MADCQIIQVEEASSLLTSAKRLEASFYYQR